VGTVVTFISISGTLESDVIDCMRRHGISKRGAKYSIKEAIEYEGVFRIGKYLYAREDFPQNLDEYDLVELFNK